MEFEFAIPTQTEQCIHKINIPRKLTMKLGWITLLLSELGIATQPMHTLTTLVSAPGQPIPSYSMLHIYAFLRATQTTDLRERERGGAGGEAAT